MTSTYQDYCNVYAKITFTNVQATAITRNITLVQKMGDFFPQFDHLTHSERNSNNTVSSVK